MDEKLDIIQEDALDEVAGGAGAKKHVQIIGCKVCCNVRSSANSKSDANIIGHANLGDRYVFLGWSGNWAKIQYGAQKAYVFTDFVKII